ncbi:MAG: GPI anchored serine-threonine rich family protein [Promethearchaeota archaeon]
MVPTSREPGTDYSIAITDSNNSKIFSLSFQFEIINPNVTYPAIYFTNPTPVSAWRAGATYVITWNCKIDLGEVTLELLKGGEVVDTLSDDTDGESHFKWEIPEDTPERNDYQIKISLNSNANIYGLSDEFRIIAPRSQTNTSRTVVLPDLILATPGFGLTILITSLSLFILYRKRKSIIGG